MGATVKSYAPFSDNIEDGKPYVITDGDFSKILSAIRGTYTDTNLIELFGSVAEIYAPVDAIASRVISGEVTLRRLKDDQIVYDNEAMNRFFESPNPFQNFNQLVYEMIVYELVTGKNFLFTNTPDTLPRVDYKNLIASYNLPADKVKIKTPEKFKLFTAREQSDVITGYSIGHGSEEQIFKTENVLYRRSHNLDWRGRKIEGRSILLSAEKAIANLIAVYEARNVIYVKRGALGAIVSKKTDASGNVALTPKEKEEILKDYNRSHGVEMKKSPVMVTNQPVDFLRIAMSIQELMPFEETLADAAAIYAVLGVPRELMPKNEGATFENQKIAERSIYQNKCIPLAKSIYQSISNHLRLTEAGLYIHADFSKIEVLQANKKEESETREKNEGAYTRMYKNGAITYNQWLIALGYEGRGPEFDKYINDMESVPMAVKIGVGGTQAMQSVVSDPALSEESKANLLVLLFGITIEQARAVVVSAPNQNQPAA